MEENNDNRNFGQNRPPRNHNRFRHGGGHRHGQQNQLHGRGGRNQRPLLTSSINGAGFSLVALAIVFANKTDVASAAVLLEILGSAVIAFGVSALISYVAQRIRPRWVEMLSDLFFIAGACLVIYVGAVLSGLLSL